MHGENSATAHTVFIEYWITSKWACEPFLLRTEQTHSPTMVRPPPTTCHTARNCTMNNAESVKWARSEFCIVDAASDVRQLEVQFNLIERCLAPFFYIFNQVKLENSTFFFVLHYVRLVKTLKKKTLCAFSEGTKRNKIKDLRSFQRSSYNKSWHDVFLGNESLQ